MRKIGVIPIGHEDYMCPNTQEILRVASTNLQEIPFVFSEMHPFVTTETDAIAAVRKLLYQEECCGILLFLSTWVETNVVVAALKELHGLPCMLWGVMPQELSGRKQSSGSYVSASMLNGVIKRLNMPCPVLISGLTDSQTYKKIDTFARAASAIDVLFYSHIGLFGYTSMSIYPGTFDHALLRFMIGPEVEQMDSYSLITAAESCSEEEVEEAMQRLADVSCCASNLSTEALRKTMGLYVALKRICKERKWRAVNVKCQYEFSKEYKCTPCVALSLLADDGIVTSCEGDILNTVSMLLLNALSKQNTWYGDSLTHFGNTLQFSPCGFLPFGMAQGKAEVINFENVPGFNGIHACGVLRPEKITFLRLVEDIGNYHIVFGTGTGCPTSPRDGIMPALDVELDGSIDRLCEEYAGQHYAIAYGDWSEQIFMVGKLMNIPVVRV